MLLSSKDKSCLWHIQPAFTQGLKSYIYSTKMFKLALKHSSSGKLIVLFVQQQKAPHFPNSRCTYMSLHTHPPPLNMHPHSEENLTIYVSGKSKHPNIAAACSNIILSFLMVQPVQWTLQLFCRNTTSHYWRLHHNALTQGKGIR